MTEVNDALPATVDHRRATMFFIRRSTSCKHAVYNSISSEHAAGVELSTDRAQLNNIYTDHPDSLERRSPRRLRDALDVQNRAVKLTKLIYVCCDVLSMRCEMLF